jgi:gliding motility-associated-like protein
VSLFTSISSFATHIVGGDLTYKCLGNDRYEVTLMVYRDCLNGNPEADFDDPASIAIYDVKNNLQVHLGQLGQILIPFNADDTLSQQSDCIIDGNGVCVQRTVYKMIATLPFIKGGYVLAYQRCCRNGTISNIIDPVETGATFISEISEIALAECNSSPVFREWPPIFICVNEQLEYNHSAMDEDGDSLIYSLCTPFLGASVDRPIPQPAPRPPYDEIFWKSPFSLDNLLGGDQALTINQQGILTATPNTIGQFLVGICVQEVRNGQIINTTRRDFQYNVVDCDQIVLTRFLIDTALVCADVVDVTITDNSTGVPEGAPYSYTVTSDKGLNLTFNEADVSFQVNGAQTLTITQSVMVSPECTSSKTQVITLDVDDSGLGFNDTIVVCAGSSIALNPGFNDKYIYTWSPTTYLMFADGPNPIATPEESITYEAVVFDPVNNCEITESVHIEVISNPGVTADFEIEKPCGSLTLTFINTSVGSETFIWTFGDPSNPGFQSTEKDPTYTYPSGGTYDVVLTIPGEDCNTIATKRLAVTGDDFVDFVRDLENCGPSLIDLNTGLNPLYKYRWEENPLISDITAAVPEVYLREDASFKVTVIDPLNDSCQIEGLVNVAIGDQLVVDLGDSIFICEAGSIALNPNGDPNLIYMWNPAGPLDDPNSFNPTANITEETRFVAKITDPNDSTCMVRIPLVVKFGLDDGGFEDGDTLIVCDSSSLFINEGANPNLVYSWSPATWLDDPTNPNPIASPLESIAYTATISDSAGVCTITKTIFIQIVDSDVLLNFDESKECDSYEVMFINQSRGANNFIWTFGDPNNPGFSSTEENPTYTYPGGGTYDVQLKSNDDPNCTAYRAKRITLTGDDFVDFVDTIRTCDPRAIELNPNRDQNYIYAWKSDPAIADTTLVNPIVSLTEDRTFMVTVTDPLNDTCTIEGTVVVITDDRLTQGLRDSILICMVGPVELNPGGNPEVSYMWSPAELLDDPTSFNPTAMITETTVFTVKIVDLNDESCMVETEVKVVLADYVKLITSESVEGACPGDSIRLSAKTELLDSWSWFDPSGDELGSESAFTIELVESGFYRIKGNVGECEYVDSVFLGLRTLEFMLNKEQAVCVDEPVEITVTSNSEFRFDSIIWMPEESIALGQGSEKVTVRPEVTTTYTAVVFFEDGCMVMDSVIVEVSDLDRFVATADPDTIFFGESTTLTATFEEGATYQWEPSDVLESPNSNTTVAIPDQTTTFTVTITDAGGCMTTKQVTVVVIMVQCEPPFVFLPNAFSPNGDNENDELFVRGKYIEEMDFFVYDRWGQLVFESHNPNDGWDGSFKGKTLAPDVYGYYLRVLCIGGDQHMEKGNVTILH